MKKRKAKNKKASRKGQGSEASLGLAEVTKQLCSLYHILPARSKGQNFLINPEVYQKIIDLAETSHERTILEVGPGLGFLTAGLAGQTKEVLAVELDDRLAKVLESRLKTLGIKNVKVLNRNVLDLADRHLPKDYQIVANLPYNITSVFLRKFLERDRAPESMVLLVQKEVAERIIAPTGQLSLLALSVQFYAEASLAFVVPASDFWPSPKVNSAVIRLDLKPKSELISKEEISLFFRLLKFGFSSKRKMLKNNLAGGLKMTTEEIVKELVKLKIKPEARAQELSLDLWQKLFGQLRKFMV